MKVHPFRWADEAEHEWTGTSGEAGPALDLAAPRHWRLRRAATGCGAFQGLRVLLYGDFQTPSTEALRRIVLAGGGQVTAFRGQPGKPLRSVLQPSVHSPPCALWRLQDSSTGALEKAVLAGGGQVGRSLGTASSFHSQILKGLPALILHSA